MKRKLTIYITITAIILIVGGSNCSKDNDKQINYETGTFPSEIINLGGINSSYDDFNVSLPQIAGELPILFSSNRGSQGSQFNIESGYIFFAFSQVDAEFLVESNMISNSFYTDLADMVNTDNDELGPYMLFNGNNGMEYFFYAEEDQEDNLNLKYLTYSPSNPYTSLLQQEPALITSLNTSSNDAYICFDDELTTAYFINDNSGNYDIMESAINEEVLFDDWLTGDPVSISVTDSVNSDYDDKCPFIRNNIMIYASNRPGGIGGFDLYYSVYNNGKWSSPTNMGPDINTEHNEYRPLIGSCPDYTNNFLLFSSDRPEGEGGYDLYFTGIDLTLLVK